jgi:spore coat protein U-like protein
MKPAVFFKRGLIVVGALCSVTASPEAAAGTATATLNVTATISANCTISTAPVAFGAYDPIVAHASSPLDGTGTITTTCTSAASPVITLGQGANADTGSTDATPLRQMASGANRLGYSLYQNIARTTTWGNTSGTAPTAVAGSGVAQAVTVYGQIAAGLNKPVGSYSDTVVATVTF